MTTLRFSHFPIYQYSSIIWILLTFVGCTNESELSENSAMKKATPVRTVAVAEEKVERTTTQPATVHPFFRTEIRAKVSGYTKEVKVDIGDFVKEGDELAVIAVPELNKQELILNAKIKRSQAEEARATAGVELAKANVLSAKAQLAEANSEKKRVAASLAAAEAEFKRTDDLVKRKSLEARVLDEVRKKRDSEVASEEAVESAIKSAEAMITVAESKQASAEADLAVAEAETVIAKQQLEELKVLISYATLKAPFAGIVTSRSVSPGDLVRESSEVGTGEPLFVVSQINKLRVHIPVPEVDAALIKRGDSITLSFPSFANEDSITAKVTRHSGDLDPSTRTMLVEAEIENKDNKLLPGMFGQATIQLSKTKVANVLPARAIRFEESGAAYVYLITDDKTVTVTPIKTGADNGKTIEVVSGIESGQLVVDAHLKRFATGDPIEPINN